MLVTVALLLKDAEERLQPLLDSINLQQDCQFEVLAIDSGSTDRTLEILSQYEVRVVQISPLEFGHGKTRNFAAANAHPESELIIYLSQDGLPANEYWLKNLTEPLINDRGVAGVFSRHVANEDTSPSMVRQLTTNWQSGGKVRLVKEMPADESAYESNKMSLIYFSNTSSAIRRSVWEDIPFMDIDFAEDAEWADRVLRAGHKLVFEPSSIVIHSHDYGFVEHLRQNVDHTNAMIQLFDPPIYRKQFTWLKLFLNIPREVWRDWRFLYLSEFHMGTTLSQRIKWVIWSPFWHLASVLGGWIGANLSRIPESVRILFSRQERIRRGAKYR
jgi:rhamnosyltransferase